MKYTENSMENMHILLLGCEQPFSDLFMNGFFFSWREVVKQKFALKNMATIPATMYIQIGNGPVEIVIVANVI